MPLEKLIIVTRNKGKFAEANEIAKAFGVELAMPDDGIGKLEIQADKLSAVSEFSAIEAYKKIKKPLIVDDSGLFINALEGFPGVYSAPIYRGIGGMPGILKLLEDKGDRSAYFECSVAFYDGKTLKSFIGRIDGMITNEMRGSGGFGYDPIFAPNGYGGKTFAELGVAEKNKVSHRRKALEAFFRWYSESSRA